MSFLFIPESGFCFYLSKSGVERKQVKQKRAEWRAYGCQRAVAFLSLPPSACKRKEWRRREKRSLVARQQRRGHERREPASFSHSSPCALRDHTHLLAYWTRVIDQQTPVLEEVSRSSRRGPRSCVRLCVSPVACCNGQKWTEKWNRTRGWQLGEDGRHAGDPGSAGARTPGSRSR